MTVLAGSLLAGAVHAAGPGYNFLDLSYLAVTPEDEDLAAERDGYEIALASPLEPHHYLYVRYNRSEDDAKTARTTLLATGLAYWLNLNSTADAYLVLSYEEHDIRGARDDIGYAGESGLRWMLSPQLELTGGGRYRVFKRTDTDQVEWFGGLSLRISAGLALTGRYEVGENESRYTVGLRLLPELAPNP